MTLRLQVIWSWGNGYMNIIKCVVGISHSAMVPLKLLQYLLEHVHSIMNGDDLIEIVAQSSQLKIVKWLNQVPYEMLAIASIGHEGSVRRPNSRY